MTCPSRQSGKETLPFNNIVALIVLLLIISTITSSYLTYKNTLQIKQELTGTVPAKVVEAQARVCVNRPPQIIQSCDNNAYVNYSYYCDIDATDADNDTIIFYDNTTVFSINTNTGEIIFIPNISHVGNYSILVTAQDSSTCANPTSTTQFMLYIKNESPPSPPPGPPPPSGGGGGGGAVPTECMPQWECTRWSSCSPAGSQTRTCYNLTRCYRGRPPEVQNCIYLLPPLPRVPREKEFFFCNFDIVEECTASFGRNEDWLYQYKGRVGVINILEIVPSGGSVLIDDNINFFAQISWIRAVDVDYDGVPDLEFISHNVEGGRLTMTGRLIKQLEVVREQPRYIEMLPWFVAESAYFAEDHACYIIIFMMLLAALLLYLLLLGFIERRERRDLRETSARQTKERKERKS
ncbi:cadherin repeat domain-containing protein [Candidatus Woesearchaeota archaeon]|nr:cadherin repeat domain-containing protein [Candidatus Woesearchaeota archaeon]